MRILIKADNLWYEKEGKILLKNVSLEIFQNDFVVLEGKNGSGKSILCQLLSFKKSPTQGAITAEKKYPLFSDAVWLLENKTVKENIKFLLPKMDSYDATFEVTELLKSLNLFEKRNSLPKELSTGQRKLLKIATFLVLEEELIFFDEPFLGLDEENKHTVLEKLIEKNKSGTTIFIATSDFSTTQIFNKRHFLVKDGNIYEL